LVIFHKLGQSAAGAAVIDQFRCCKALPRRRESILLLGREQNGFPPSRE
jgi:hypothetical protein